MFSAMRRRIHVTPASVIAGLALVFAMTGGAYAAKKYLITSTKQISPSVLKSLQGKAGAAGAPGAAGAQGPAGPAGPVGKDGNNGANGKDGAAGKDGASGKTGATGPTGKEGSPWVTGGTLPSGATETGVWRFRTQTTVVQDGEGKVTEVPDAEQYVPISFPIPLTAAAATVEKYEDISRIGTPTENCHGSAVDPKAEPGFLCVYASPFQSNFLGNPFGVYKLAPAGEEVGVSTSGALLYWPGESVPVDGHSAGSFAVTAP